MNNPKLIISADDYGLNKSVNDGILLAVKKRTVTCVHVLVNAVTPSDMDKLLAAVKAAGGDCGIGLHLNMTYGLSVIQKATNFNYLSDQKYQFYDLSQYNHHSTNYNHVYRELEAQVNLMGDYLGGKDKIDTISSHHNLHFFDKRFIRIICKLSKEDKIPMRSPVFWRTKVQCPKTFPYPKGLKHLVRDGLKTRKKCQFKSTKKMLTTAIKGKKLIHFRRLALRKGGGKVPNNTCGHWYGQPHQNALNFTLINLAKLNTIRSNYATEIYTHLALNTESETENLVYDLKRRVKELEVLTNPAFVDFCDFLYKRNDIDFGSFRKVLT